MKKFGVVLGGLLDSLVVKDIVLNLCMVVKVWFVSMGLLGIEILFLKIVELYARRVFDIMS